MRTFAFSCALFVAHHAQAEPPPSLTGSAPPVAARAAPPSGAAPPNRDEARAQAELGDAAFATGRCRQALEHWSAAQALLDAPTLTLRRARCHALLGEVTVATRLLRRAAAEPSVEEPPAFLEARLRARAELRGIEARQARLEVALDAGTTPVHISLDGARIDLDAARSLLIDPGRHRLAISAGAATHEQWIEASEGETVHLPLRLTHETIASQTSPWPAVGASTIAVGATSLAVGAVLGVLALELHADLTTTCGAKHDLCSRSDQARIDELVALSTAADTTLIAGGVVSAIGVTIFALAPGATPPRQVDRLEVVAGVGGLALTGSY